MDPDEEIVPPVQEPAPTKDFSERPHGERPKKPEHLPPSSDQDFWTRDAETHQLTPEEIERQKQAVIIQMTHHSFKREGPYIICTSCPFAHTIPVNADDFEIVEGGKLKARLDK